MSFINAMIGVCILPFSDNIRENYTKYFIDVNSEKLLL